MRFFYTVILISLACYAASGQTEGRLKHFLTVEDGLSHNEVTSIVQDKDGFIWIGTRGGLNRYDGYEFEVFNQVAGDSNSLVNPSIESLFVDSKGYIWIGTKSGGVSRFDPSTGDFFNLVSNYRQTSDILPVNRVLSFYEDKKGRIWMGSWRRGVFVYDQENNSSNNYLLSEATVNSIVETEEGKVWIGTTLGLFEYIAEADTFRLLNTGNCQETTYDLRRNVLWIAGSNGLTRFDLRNNTWSSSELIREAERQRSGYFTYESLLLDGKNNLWVGTWGNGLYTYQPEAMDFNRFFVYPENRQTLNKDYDTILDIFQDREGNIWMGTNGGGVCMLSPKLRFNSIGYHPEQEMGMSNTRIMSVVDDKKGNLWLGTIGSGLFWSPDREKIYHVEHPELNRPEFFIIKFIYEDLDGKVWIGSNNGTFEVNFVNGRPKLESAFAKYGRNIFSRQGVSLLDAKGMIWFGTLQTGLHLFDKSNNYLYVKSFRKGREESGDLRSDRISYLLNDSKGRIWIGTYNGLHVFNPADSTIAPAEDLYNIDGTFTGNIITCLNEDQKGNIWIGTPNGLNRLTETGENEFKLDFFTEDDGLASNFIKGIANDLSGNTWMSTNTGISKFDSRNHLIVNFDESDGVNGKNFTEASVFRNDRGELFFGGSQGLTYFFPEEIKEQPLVPKPVFTRLNVSNEQVEIGKKYRGREILNKSIAQTDEIKLSYSQNRLEVHFSALNFTGGGKNKYQYITEGHDEEWTDIGTRRFILINNLPPGKYALKVKSMSRHNVLNEDPAVLSIVIEPPLWRTWYALAFYVLMVLGIVSVIRWNAVKQTRLANNLEMEKMRHEQDQKMHEMRLRFFTNISHEFRTPLTLILAPLKELIGKKSRHSFSDEVVRKIDIIQRNAQRLMNMVNQLLDMRKLETGNMKLSAMEMDLENFVSEICQPFYELAQINDIRFRFKSLLNTKKIWIDHEKLEIILNNLISNAFKSVKGKGKIDVALFEEEEEVLLSVSDNGPGIPETEIGHIFDRFYRVDNRESHSSSGIGLALSKRFAEMHKGTITVTSTPGELTEFVVVLPKGDDHLEPDEKITDSKDIFEYVKQTGSIPLLNSVKNKISAKSSDCILIVEDNQEVRQYLIELLEPLYCVEWGANGMEGIEKAEEIVPSLIISDVMMPEMDGFEFCKRVRSSERTSTIPFIFLTAKSDERFRLMGIQIGADDFISKPFDPELLLQKVENILKRREKLKRQFSRSVRLEPSDIEISSTSEILIEKAIAIIENNLQNDKFTSETLAAELNMSGSSLYRKLKGITNSSTAEFIRSIRIKRAAQLLADRERTITEIAYEVGFNDVKHFRTVFIKQFGCTPSEYREKL